MPAPILFIAIGAFILFLISVWITIWFLRRVVSRWIDRRWVRPSQVIGSFFLLAGAVLMSSAFILPNALLVLATCYGLLGAFCMASGLERFLVPPTVETRPIWYEGSANLQQAATGVRHFSLLWLALFMACICLSIVCITAAREMRSERNVIHRNAIDQLAALGGKYQQGDVILTDPTVEDRHLQILSGLKYVTGVYLGNSGISNDGLRHLATLKHLTTISLSGTAVDDAGLHHLEQLNRLHTVALRATKVTGTGVTFATLSPSKLNYLDLSGCPITREGLEQLARVQCRHLSLAETDIGDDMLPQLEALSVEHLNVTDTRLSTSAAKRLVTSTRRVLHTSSK